MNASTRQFFWEMSGRSTQVDRRRSLRMSFGVAGSGVFSLAAIAILTAQNDFGYVSYVSDGGLRPGTAFGVLVMIVPFVLFALQALRTGTAARERRLAALSLAGATRSDLRRLALLEGTRAAVRGALASGPVYIALWVVLGPGMPMGSKILPTPGIAVVLGWIGLVVVLGAAGGLLAQQATHPATVSPLGLTRRRSRPLTLIGSIAPIASLVFTLVIFLFVHADSFFAFLLLPLGAITFVVTAGPWLVLLIGKLAARQGGLLTMLAARRLLADVRTPGRIVGVMAAVGVVFGIVSVMLANVTSEYSADSRQFYLAGMGAVTLAAVLAAVVATSALVVGATEQILDNARSTAVFVALAASPDIVSRIVRRQMLLAALPPTLIGALAGWGFYGYVIGVQYGWPLVLLTFPLAIGIAVLAATLAALIATQSVRPAILSTSGPENLRTV
ncbi:hypothetical protein [Kineosporia babensis]|uniref:FtsX-like permease family protein n=1 Tax=Kineosporia babensis TaxID=499548 RepID=A0A9X1N8Z6_9ACTN|nr:hypothetical protein [Kineosporia babensis]MCD5309360.1 hypothetical protein [Kineosporia babensis]